MRHFTYIYIYIFSSFATHTYVQHTHTCHPHMCHATHLNVSFHMYVYIYGILHLCLSHVCHSHPPDPIHHVCSLAGKYIPENYFTYRPLQIFKILFRRFYSPESDPPHKIMCYDVYYSTQLSFLFPPDRISQVEMICIGGVPVSKRRFGGGGP